MEEGGEGGRGGKEMVRGEDKGREEGVIASSRGETVSILFYFFGCEGKI